MNESLDDSNMAEVHEPRRSCCSWLCFYRRGKPADSADAPAFQQLKSSDEEAEDAESGSYRANESTQLLAPDACRSDDVEEGALDIVMKAEI